MATSEFALIEKYFAQATASSSQVLAGIGDDCALLRPRPGYELAVSTDSLLCGVHFPPQAAAADIARRALAVNLSDLAAMAAEPIGFTLAISLPQFNEQWLADFSAALHQQATFYGIPLIGGDTTSGPLAITITVLGEVPAGQALRRSGAEVGDNIYLSGSLGDGAAALALIERASGQATLAKEKISQASAEYLSQRFYSPAIDLQFAQSLRGIATAAIDVSDGLLADLGHILRASDVAAEVMLDKLPISSQARSVDQSKCERWALTGGDDYRLCFTVPPANSNALADMCDRITRHAETGIHKIGVIVAAQQQADSANNRLMCINAAGEYLDPCSLGYTEQGYDHFSSE